MTTQDMIDIIGQINYKPNWSILVHKDERHYVQIKVTGGTCSQTGKPADWVTGKRYLSEHMCSQELVGLVFALIKDAEEHEMREFFRYKGRAIFNPHFDPDKLAEFASKKESYCVREDSMSNA